MTCPRWSRRTARTACARSVRRARARFSSPHMRAARSMHALTQSAVLRFSSRLAAPAASHGACCAPAGSVPRSGGPEGADVCARARVCGAQKLQGLWDEEVERCLGRKDTEPSLLRVLVRAHGREYAVGNALKLPQDVLLFAGPFLLQRLVVFLDPQLTADRDLRFQDGLLLCCGSRPCSAPNTAEHHLPAAPSCATDISRESAWGFRAYCTYGFSPLTHSFSLSRLLALSPALSPALLPSRARCLWLSPARARSLCRSVCGAVGAVGDAAPVLQ
jgi:hypothetical protein